MTARLSPLVPVTQFMLFVYIPTFMREVVSHLSLSLSLFPSLCSLLPPTAYTRNSFSSVSILYTYAKTYIHNCTYMHAHTAGYKVKFDVNLIQFPFAVCILCTINKNTLLHCHHVSGLLIAGHKCGN